MAKTRKPLSEHSWIEQIFKAAQVSKGGIVRRSCKTVEAITTFERLNAAADARGFQIVKMNGQYVISCTPDLVMIVKK